MVYILRMCKIFSTFVPKLRKENFIKECHEKNIFLFLVCDCAMFVCVCRTT